MTVHQVEEYYIHIDTEGYSSAAIDRVRDHLENDGHDFEIQEDCIVIDGFECGNEAEIIQYEVMGQLNN